jgi:hypothetical protein
MVFYGLLDRELLQVVDLHAERARAEAGLADILDVEPWTERYAVVAVDLGGAEPVVEVVG